MACLRVSGFQGGSKSALLLLKQNHTLGNPCVPMIVCNRNSKSRSRRMRVVANPDFTETGASLRFNQANFAIPWESISIDDANTSDADEKEITSQRLDQWLRESVTEIVSNVDEAPFLMQIYSNERDNKRSPGGMVIEKAIPNGWPEMKKRWESGRSQKPNGIILVKELDNGDGEGEGDSSSKVWGILIQGKGLKKSACYVLKTCRVQSTFGFCTHYYVFRMDCCFLESLETQLRNLWLV